MQHIFDEDIEITPGLVLAVVVGAPALTLFVVLLVTSQPFGLTIGGTLGYIMVASAAVYLMGEPLPSSEQEFWYTTRPAAEMAPSAPAAASEPVTAGDSCPHCGEEVAASANFCPNCGQNLKSSSDAPKPERFEY